MKNAVCQASNDYMVEHFVDEGMYTSMVVQKWDPEYAVEEVERVGDEVVAVYSWFGPKAPWGAEQFDPIFEALVDHDLPLLLHGSPAYWPQHSYIGDEMLTWIESLGFDWPIHGIVNLLNLIMRGVFDRYPDLNVVVQEAGHRWVPFLRYRMDEFYEMHPEDVQFTPRKHADGEFYAISNRCVHQHAPLCQAGETKINADDTWTSTRGGVNAEECTVSCPWHLWEWDLQTGGHAVWGKRIATFECEVADGDVYVAAPG